MMKPGPMTSAQTQKHLAEFTEWYEEALKGNRAIQDAWDASHPNNMNFKRMREILAEIHDQRKPKDEPVTEVKQNTFNEPEVITITRLKKMAAGAFQQLNLPQQYEDNIVLAGGCFTSWFYKESVKDLDFFIFGDMTIQSEIMNELHKRGTVRDVSADYLREAKHVTAVFNEKISNRQFIYTDCKSRKGVIDAFDLAHTQISYYRGQIYLNRRTYDAIKNKTLIVNEGRTVPQWRMDKFQKRGFKFPEQQQVSTSSTPWGPYITNLSDPRSGARVNPMRGTFKEVVDP